MGKDSAEAVRWFRLAAEKGHATAQYNLGIKYQTGDGVEKDSAEAAKWYLLAADQGTGHAKARYNLGVMYATGDGVQKDPLEAVLWYRKAAELNYAKAQANLGFMYATGDGVRRDPAEAVAWYRKAADQGDATALYNLGVMAAVGDGVPKDLVQAHVWMKEAGAQGDKNARPNLEAIEQKMTAEQKAEAQQLTSTARKAEHKARPSGWYAKFRPGAGARLRFQADGRCTTAEEGAFCRFGIWVAAAGPEAEVELLPTAEDPAAADAIEKVGTFSQPNIEKIISLKPDIIFCAGLEQAPAIEKLRQLGLKVHVSDPSNFSELFDSIESIGRLTARDNEAAGLIKKMKDQIESVRSAAGASARAANRPKIFVEIWHSPLMTAGIGSFLDELITLAGGVNIAHDTPRPYSRFSAEKVIRLDPDLIILAYMDKEKSVKSIERRFGWGGISAVKDHRVYDDIDPDLYLRPGPRLVEGLKEIRKKVDSVNE